MIKNKFIHLIAGMAFSIFAPTGLFATDADLVSVYVSSSAEARAPFSLNEFTAIRDISSTVVFMDPRRYL